MRPRTAARRELNGSPRGTLPARADHGRYRRFDVPQHYASGSFYRVRPRRRADVRRTAGGCAGRVRQHGGTVTDTSGGALPGVTVTITSVERKTVDSVVTNESGFYVKERLVPGNYEVKAELASFKAAVVPTVRVSVDAQTPCGTSIWRSVS